MPIFILTGSDTRALTARREQLAASGEATQRFDLTVDAGASLAVATTTLPLFAGSRTLVAGPVGDLSAEHAARVAHADASTTVVLWGPSLPSVAAKQALTGATWEAFATPTSRDAAQRVRTLAATAGVRLDPRAERLLADSAAQAWPRVCDTVTQLASTGRTLLTADDVTAMLGSSPDRTAGWQLCDRVESGDLAGALELAARCEPIAAIAALGRRLELAGRCVDAQAHTARDAQQATGANPAAAGAALGLASRLGRSGVARSWTLIARADTAAKISRRPQEVLDVLVSNLAMMWGAKA